MRNLIFVKLGGGLITDKSNPYTVKTKVIKRLSEEIKEVRKDKKTNLLIGHGGGSFPHTSAKKYKTAQGFINKQSEYGFCVVQNDAAKLNRIIINSLIKTGEKAFSISPSSCCLAQNSRVKEFYLKTINKLLEYNILPVIYGDAVIDIKKGCSILSTEELFVYLAKKLKPKKIIIADKVDGVYTADPFKNKKAELIPEINKTNWSKIKKYLEGSNGIDVTGGMIHKVEKSIELAKLGFEVNIINGKKPNYFKKALLEERLGTIIKW